MQCLDSDKLIPNIQLFDFVLLLMVVITQNSVDFTKHSVSVLYFSKFALGNLCI